MAAITPITLTLLLRVGDSDVLNEVGTMEVDCVVEPIGERRPTDAPGAEYRITSFDLPGALRDAADTIEAAAS